MTAERKAEISIFSIAAAFGFSVTGLMPVLDMISEKYSEIDTSVIQLMQTLPYALIIVGSLILSSLTIRFSKKKIAMAALLIIGVCGVLPFFFDSFYVLFITRLFIGLGFGIAGPLNTAIISDFFAQDRRAGIMGLHVVGMGVGSIAGNLLGGLLAESGLRYFYLVYLLIFLCLAAVLFLLPETPKTSARKSSELKITKMVYSLCAISFVFTLFIAAYGINISMYIAEKIGQDPGAAGLASAVNAAVVTGTGIIFSKIAARLRKATLPFAVFAAGAGYFVMLFVPGMPGILLASALCGIAPSCFNAMSGYLVSISVEPEAVAKASGIFSIVGSVGGLIAPLVLGELAKAFGGNTAGNQFTAALGGMMIFGIVISIYIGRSKVEY